VQIRIATRSALDSQAEGVGPRTFRQTIATNRRCSSTDGRLQAAGGQNMLSMYR
jgi:hypothetical protein